MWETGAVPELLEYIRAQRQKAPADGEDAPTEGELWDVERLQDHGRLLAEGDAAPSPARRVNLKRRLRRNAEALRSSHAAIVAAVREGRAITPAAEWLLDNFHVISEQLGDVPLRLTPETWRELPLSSHPDASGWPRVFHIAQEYLRHALWEFNPASLLRLLKGYQDISPLGMQELWALYPILRIVLVEELRRIAVRIEESLAARAAADATADSLMHEQHWVPDAPAFDDPLGLEGGFNSAYVVQLAHRLRGMEERGRRFLDGFSEKLASRGTNIDDCIQRQHARRSASNLVARNIFTSLRALASFDWRSFFERASHVELLLRAHADYVGCDRRTRDRYRNSIAELATATRQHELTITRQALALLGPEHGGGPPDADLGSLLIGPGRPQLEAAVGFPVSASHRLRRWVVRHAHGLYLGGIGILTLVLTGLALYVGTDWHGASGALLALLAVLAAVPASEVATGTLHRLWLRAFPPRYLPRLALESGLEPGMDTLVVMPTILRSPAEVAAACRQLQVHALANPDPRISFALLSDWADSPTEESADDKLVLEAARREIAALNEGERVPDHDGPRFHLLHRRRQWSEGERCFMGWERKRGKLEELNRLLLGKGPTSFLPAAGGRVVAPRGIRYVLTVDADTRIPLGAVKDLVGVAAHPMNRPVLSTSDHRVIRGYGVLQPRITPLLPGAEERSLYREIVTSGSGVDPYAAAVSDLHQDVFGEGLFTGKGLYDLHAWETALAGRVPQNRLLSHDLFEGLFARCGLVTDIELFEDFPSHSEVAAARSHRWIRGDWQLLPWLIGLRGPLPPMGRWKMLDNLRRSVSAPSSVALLITAFSANATHPLVWLIVVLCPWLWPALNTAVAGLVTGPAPRSLRTHLRRLATDLAEDLGRSATALTLLVQNAWLSVDAIARVLFRLVFSRRRLLEWTTAAQLKAGRSDALASFVWPLRGASIVVVLAVATFLLTNPPALGKAAPLLALWWLSPLLARFLSRPLETLRPQEELSKAAERGLREVARRTWSFFEQFVTADDHFLPPDNFQEVPNPVVAHRSSPTNFGLYLLATVAARDFGWLGLQQLNERLAATLATLQKLERFEGHFFNWYDTQTLQPLLPRYISTVDSGNLAGHLLTLRQACIEMQNAPLLSGRALRGPLDAIALCRQALVTDGHDLWSRSPVWKESLRGLRRLQRTLNQDCRTLVAARTLLQSASQDIASLLENAPAATPAGAIRWLRLAGRDIESHLHDLQCLLPVPIDPALDPGELQAWQSLEAALPRNASLDDVAACLARARAMASARNSTAGIEASHARARWLADVEAAATLCAALPVSLSAVAAKSRELVAGMSFGFLFDRGRGLFAIGYQVADRRLDDGYYDLLASEARLASLVAIAKRDAPRSHWFRLGRRLTGGSRHPVLASWSGSMFEYLMPALVMEEPGGSLLDQTNRRAVSRQIRYGEQHGLPWGISESAYNVRDRDYTYQYSSFGLPALGLKRGLASDYVVAPYATALAAMYDPHEAYHNYRALAQASAEGEFGYYEALDYTASRLPEGKSVAVVRAYMAHHHGMTLVALDNALHNRIMQARFHAEPRITAVDLLLQERSIRFMEAPALDEAEVPLSQTLDETPEVSRSFEGHSAPTPVTHLLSNRNYTVMLTDSGAGYSSCRSRAVTRWREDATRDCWGSFIYLYDLENKLLWSAGFQPTATVPDEYRVLFNEDSAVVSRRDGFLRTTMKVIVATEDDGELRQVTLRNDGLWARRVEVTSFAELVLAPQAADIAHPGFSNLFVQTEFIPESGALLATRRPRSAREAPVWALHVIAGVGPPADSLQHETDRAQFLGRGRDARSPRAMQGARPLSNTVGNVLDPVFSLRTQVIVPPRGSTTVTFATFLAGSREQALALVAKYRTPALFEHVSEAAWTFARAEIYYLQSSLSEATLFQAMASHLLVSTQQLRAGAESSGLNALDVAHLWRFGISGDRPMLLVRCHSQEDLGFVQQCLRAQEYLRVKRVAIDVVILNERRHSYVQDLQHAIERSARAFTAPAVEGEDRGGIYPLAVDAISEAERAMLLSLARVVLNPAQGSLAELLHRPAITRAAEPVHGEPAPASPMPMPAPGPGPGRPLEYWNGLGGFASAGQEYSVSLPRSGCTPAPWSNVLANELFGSLVTERGSMCTWSMNSRENQLTPWSNDAVCDPSGEAFYIQEDGEGLWSPAAQPIQRSDAQYEVRHGQGYSHFDVSCQDLASCLTVVVAVEDPVKLCRLRITNRRREWRRLTVVSYVEWALGATRAGTKQAVVTRLDAATGAQFASNPALIDFGSRIAFCDLGGRQQHCTDSRHEFLGRNGSLAAPAGVDRPGSWTVGGGNGRDPCCAFATTIDLAPGATEELHFVLGQAADAVGAGELVERYRALDADAVLAAVKERWDQLLGAVQIRTPDRALDLLFNRWLLYQTIACRLWGRTAFYQSGGAFGFRDQLQDVMALVLCAPDQARRQLLLAASRQFVEGDVQHWWHPPSGRGVRTHFSDDRIWLPFAVHHYIQATGDKSPLDEMIPFLEGPTLPLAQEDAHYVPAISATEGSLYEHCARALDVSLRVGAHDLPLMGGGDWNDGMNRVGHEGRGESVWLAWFLVTSLRQFLDVAQERGDSERAQRWRGHIDRLTRACEREAWDGDWYRRAFFDDGSTLGSSHDAECRIDSLAQSWAVLSGAAEPGRARTAMAAVEERLVRHREGLVLLFDPPFDVSPVDPGYVKGYLPGLRENGGQYTHAAVWVLMAQAQLGHHDKVGELLKMLNPVNRTIAPGGSDIYKVEPYVLAADIYSGGELAGHGGWTWYTGAAGWFYRAILEYVLGIQVAGDTLRIKPCVPSDWPDFEVSLRLPQVDYVIRMSRDASAETALSLDGLAVAGDLLPLLRDGHRHVVHVTLR